MARHSVHARRHSIAIARSSHSYRTAFASADPTIEPIDDRQFEIEFLDPSIEVFCFTFG
jgi:hypothetical protein